ncbi:MAG: tetratricopeptide repeat protein [bacterium]
MGQKDIVFTEQDDTRAMKGKQSKSEDFSSQQIYKNNATDLSREADMIIYGDYSFTSEEIYIIPKLYDLRNNKNYTLQSVRITDHQQKFSLTRFDNMVAEYRDRIKSLKKSSLNLEKMALVWEKREGQEISSYDRSLYRSLVIDATKLADTISSIEVMNWELIEPQYLNNESYAGTAKDLGVDIIYAIYFEPVSEFDIKVSAEVFTDGSTYPAFAFEFDLIDELTVDRDIVEDLYQMLSDIEISDSFDFSRLSIDLNEPHELEQRGYEFYKEGKYYLSNLAYRKAYENSSEVYFNAYQTYMFGENFYQTGQTERALRYFYKALDIQSDYHFAWWGIAFVKFETGDYVGATNAFLKVEEINPEYEKGTVQYNIGLSAYESEQYELAMQYFEKALELEYKKPEDAYYYVALIYESQMDYEGGIAYFNARRADKPDVYSINVYLAYFYFVAGEDALYTGNYEKTMQYMDEAERIYANELNYDDYTYSLISDITYYRLLAALYLNNYEQAYKITETGIAEGDFDPSTIYRDNGTELTFVTSDDDRARFEEIIRYYKRHADVNPSDTAIDNIYNSIGYYYSLLGDIDAAAIYFEKALESDPENLTAQMNMMELYLVLKDYNKVREKAETILNSALMRSELENNSGNRTLFHFLLFSEEVATGKAYAADQQSFTDAMNEEDFSTGWDFSLYLEWLEGLSRDKKKLLFENYQLLEERIKRSSSQSTGTVRG